MIRLKRLGWTLQATYTEKKPHRFLGYYWFNKEAEKMFHKDSWIAELMNIEETVKMNNIIDP